MTSRSGWIHLSKTPPMVLGQAIPLDATRKQPVILQDLRPVNVFVLNLCSRIGGPLGDMRLVFFLMFFFGQKEIDCCGPSVSHQPSLPITPHPHDPLPHAHQIVNTQKPLPPSCFISCSDRYMFKPMCTVNFSYSLGSCSFVWFTQGCPRIESSSQPSQASSLFNVLSPTPLFVSHLQPTTFPSNTHFALPLSRRTR